MNYNKYNVNKLKHLKLMLVLFVLLKNHGPNISMDVLDRTNFKELFSVDKRLNGYFGQKQISEIFWWSKMFNYLMNHRLSVSMDVLFQCSVILKTLYQFSTFAFRG